MMNSTCTEKTQAEYEKLLAQCDQWANPAFVPAGHKPQGHHETPLWHHREYLDNVDMIATIAVRCLAVTAILVVIWLGLKALGESRGITSTRASLLDEAPIGL